MKKILSFFLLFSIFLLGVTKTVNAGGIYGCVWNPLNPPGQQCILDPGNTACNEGSVPSACDAPDQVSCEDFNGACVTPTSLTFACGSDGACVQQEGGPFPTKDDCTVFCRPKVMYNCIDPNAAEKCQRVFTQFGEYTSVNECNTKCVPAPPGGVGKVLCFDGTSIYTAIGCVPISAVRNIVAFFITWGLGIGGGWAILLFVFAGISIITSSGDPTKLQAGKELLISAISGVVLLIFCVFLLRLIGVNVLRLF